MCALAAAETPAQRGRSVWAGCANSLAVSRLALRLSLVPRPPEGVESAVVQKICAATNAVRPILDRLPAAKADVAPKARRA